MDIVSSTKIWRPEGHLHVQEMEQVETQEAAQAARLLVEEVKAGIF